MTHWCKGMGSCGRVRLKSIMALRRFEYEKCCQKKKKLKNEWRIQDPPKLRQVNKNNQRNKRLCPLDSNFVLPKGTANFQNFFQFQSIWCIKTFFRLCVKEKKRGGGTLVHQSMTPCTKYLCGALSTYHPIDYLSLNFSFSFIYLHLISVMSNNSIAMSMCGL